MDGKGQDDVGWEPRSRLKIAVGIRLRHGEHGGHAE